MRLPLHPETIKSLDTFMQDNPDLQLLGIGNKHNIRTESRFTGATLIVSTKNHSVLRPNKTRKPFCGNSDNMIYFKEISSGGSIEQKIFTGLEELNRQLQELRGTAMVQRTLTL